MSDSFVVNDSSSKKRSPNYSDTDKQMFLSTFETYKNIIENKKTDSLVGMQKKAWKEVTELYNSNVLQARNSEQLQQLWRNFKKSKRPKYCSSRRRSHFQPGGGAYKTCSRSYIGLSKRYVFLHQYVYICKDYLYVHYY